MNVCLSILMLLALAAGIYFFLLYRKSNNEKKSLVSRLEQLRGEKAVMEKKLLEASKTESEKKQLADELIRSEEKNKKLWNMSETVHRERKLVDEANIKLNEEKKQLETDKAQLETEKTKLTADKIKLDEKVKKLWSTSTAIHKEKERINELKIEIEHKHQEILDSVNYARRIQRALLASNKLLKQNLPEMFLLFQPKDIVSGDFYWASKVSDSVFSVLTGDSTGHGVPGAIMSILNISCLNEAVSSKGYTEPNQILDYARNRIMEHMLNDGSEEGGKDGMDAVICNYDLKNLKLKFAAANNPLWLIRNEELTEFKPDKMPVGKAMGEIKPFTLQVIDLQKDDLIITLTDGFADQFGGPKGKKFMYKPLKDLILSLRNETMDEMKKQLQSAFEKWRGSAEQVDDVLIMGVRV